MNKFEKFLSFGAVVEVRRNNMTDVYNFIVNILKVGFMKEYAVEFINSCKLLDNKQVNMDMSTDELLDLLDNYYTDDYFWHLVDINDGKKSRICIEYQYGKGFNWSDKKNYENIEGMEILSINDFVDSLGFNEYTYIKVFLSDELDVEKQDLAKELDDYCDLSEYGVVKFYGDKEQYGIIDRQNEDNLIFGTDRLSLDDVCKYLYDSMCDYNLLEGNFEDIVTEDDDKEYVLKTIDTMIKLGKKYKLADENRLNYFERERNYYANL